MNAIPKERKWQEVALARKEELCTKVNAIRHQAYETRDYETRNEAADLGELICQLSQRIKSGTISCHTAEFMLLTYERQANRLQAKQNDNPNTKED